MLEVFIDFSATYLQAPSTKVENSVCLQYVFLFAVFPEKRIIEAKNDYKNRLDSSL